MLTETELAAIEARAAAATPGPLQIKDWGEYGLIGRYGRVAMDIIERPDADLFAHARTDILTLCTEVRRLRAQLPVPYDAAGD